VQNVKDALKPLFFGAFSPLSALNRFVVTMVACHLAGVIAAPGRVRTLLTLLPLGVIAAEPFIWGGSISRAEVAGTVLGIAAWWLFVCQLRRNAGFLAIFLASQILFQGLMPFVFNPHPGHFSFIPFSGLLDGSIFNAALWILEKTFLYGALVWLPVQAGLSLRFSVIASVILLTGIELAQMFVPGRVSEITDPFLAVILGLFLYFADRRGIRNASAARR